MEMRAPWQALNGVEGDPSRTVAARSASRIASRVGACHPRLRSPWPAVQKRQEVDRSP